MRRFSAKTNSCEADRRSGSLLSGTLSSSSTKSSGLKFSTANISASVCGDTIPVGISVLISDETLSEVLRSLSKDSGAASWIFLADPSEVSSRASLPCDSMKD